jgi:hypothetical protein
MYLYTTNIGDLAAGVWRATARRAAANGMKSAKTAMKAAMKKWRNER